MKLLQEPQPGEVIRDTSGNVVPLCAFCEIDPAVVYGSFAPYVLMGNSVCGIHLDALSKMMAVVPRGGFSIEIYIQEILSI